MKFLQENWQGLFSFFFFFLICLIKLQTLLITMESELLEAFNYYNTLQRSSSIINIPVSLYLVNRDV